MTLIATSTYCPNLKDSITKTLSIQSPIAGVRLPLVDAVIGDNTKLQARNIAGMSYLWSPANLLSDPTISNPIATISAEQEFKILMTTIAGCQTTDTMLVRAFKEFTVFVPKAFSPNGDGINDKLIPNFVGLKELKLFRIYNRAGQVVFESSNAGDGWDGNTNGNPQPVDTYMWVVEAISKYGAPIRETGLVTLLR
jgi:gliding motility-associated-like protein